MKALLTAAATAALATAAFAAPIPPGGGPVDPPCNACGPTCRPGNFLNIQGSTTLRPIVDRANTVAQCELGVDVVNRNLGSTSGIRALIEGECENRGIWTPGGACDIGGDGVVGTGDGPADIGIASRPAKDSEVDVAEANGLCLIEHPVAIDGLGIIINNDPRCDSSATASDCAAADAPIGCGQFDQGGMGLADFLLANKVAPPAGGLQDTEIAEIMHGGTDGVASLVNWLDLGVIGSADLPDITVVSRQEEGGTYGAFIDLYICNGNANEPTDKCESGALFPKNTGSDVDPFEWLRPPSSCNPTMCGVNDEPCPDPPAPCAITPGSPTQFVGSNDEVVDGVAGICGGIGYAGISFIDTALAADKPVLSFPVTASAVETPVAASFPSTLDGTFDFTRNLFAYTVGTPCSTDPRGQYIELLFSRLGQANVFESGFVPINGVLPRNDGKLLGDHAQIVLEEVGSCLISESATRIDRKLEFIACAEATLNDPGSTDDEIADATTDLVESQFSIRETVDETRALVCNKIDRVQECLDGICAADSCDNPGQAAAALAEANTLKAEAEAALDSDDIFASDFATFLARYEAAFAAADAADAACNPESAPPTGGGDEEDEDEDEEDDEPSGEEEDEDDLAGMGSRSRARR